MSDEMSSPITRAELREELASLRAHLATKVELREELAKLDTKIETWGGALLHRIERGEQTLRLEMKTMRHEILDEMARLLKGAVEQFQRALGVFDEPYRDLPTRVARLEAKVFPPKRTRRR